MAVDVWSWTVGMVIKENQSSTMDTHSPPKCPLLKSLRPSMSMLLKWVHYQNQNHLTCGIKNYRHTRRKWFSPWLCNIAHLSQASPYPLILSLENHCSVEQQTVMAQHLRTILGDKLLTKPLDGLDSHTLPSPEVRSHCSISTQTNSHKSEYSMSGETKNVVKQLPETIRLRTWHDWMICPERYLKCAC